MSDGEGKGKKIAKSIYFIIYPQDQDNGRRTFLSVYYYNVLSSNTHGHLRIHIHYYKSRGNIITLMYTYIYYYPCIIFNLGGQIIIRAGSNTNLFHDVAKHGTVVCILLKLLLFSIFFHRPLQ